MQRQILLFAAVHDAAGSDSVAIDIADDATAMDVLHELSHRFPTIAPLLGSCRVALDHRYVPNSEPIASAIEIAIIPPVSGG